MSNRSSAAVQPSSSDDKYRSIRCLDFGSFGVWDFSWTQGMRSQVDQMILETSTRIPFNEKIYVALDEELMRALVSIDGTLYQPKEDREFAQAILALRTVGYEGRSFLEALRKEEKITEEVVREALKILKEDPVMQEVD